MNLFIQETTKFSDLLSYLLLIAREGFWMWIWYVMVVKIFGGKNTKLVIIKDRNEIIGGFMTTDLPLAKYKPYNWFSKEIKIKIDELMKGGYQYFCCFVVKKSFRNRGVGTFAFESYLKKNYKKIWFTSSPKAVNFYLRNGARLFYKSKYNIYIFE